MKTRVETVTHLGTKGHYALETLHLCLGLILQRVSKSY